MEGTILRSQVYEALMSGEPFDMVWISCDRRRGTGGDLISAESWAICSAEAEFALRPALKSDEMDNLPKTAPKDPNHGKNGTVNVFNPANSGYHPISVHLDLIQFFNGKRVIN